MGERGGVCAGAVAGPAEPADRSADELSGQAVGQLAVAFRDGRGDAGTGGAAGRPVGAVLQAPGLGSGAEVTDESCVWSFSLRTATPASKRREPRRAAATSRSSCSAGCRGRDTWPHGRSPTRLEKKSVFAVGFRLRLSL